jgi:hypothetical protein
MTVLAALFLVLHSGCAKLDLTDSLNWLDRNDKPQTPDRMMAIWTDTVLNQPARPGIRGFGGRMMFHTLQTDDPVKVDGTLTVYTYDDSHTATSQRTPSRKFVFRRDQLPSHYSKSALGHSYSIWLPWDEVGNEETIISLIARFESPDGKVVMSEMARQLLPGPASQPTAAREGPAARIPLGDQASAEEDSLPGQTTHELATHGVPDTQLPDSGRALETLTLAVPPGFVSGTSGALLQQAANLQTDAPPSTASTTAGHRADKASHAEPSKPTDEAASNAIRFAPLRSPAPYPPRARPRPHPVRTRPRPAEWPSAPTQEPRSFPPHPMTATAPTAQSIAPADPQPESQ